MSLDNPPVAGSELDTLEGALERQRRIFRWKTAGLTAEQMHRRLAPSTMHLAGLLKHLALSEDWHWQELWSGLPLPAPWDEVDFDAISEDWLWTSSLEDDPAWILATYDEAVARSRAALAASRRTGGGDPTSRWSDDDGTPVSLRFLLTLLIEEYARHNGHVDLIRQSVDGLVGERPDDSSP